MQFKILIQTKNTHLVAKNRHSANLKLFKPATFMKKSALILNSIYLSKVHRECNHTYLEGFAYPKIMHVTTDYFNKLMHIHCRYFYCINNKIPGDQIVSDASGQQVSESVVRGEE